MEPPAGHGYLLDLGPESIERANSRVLEKPAPAVRTPFIIDKEQPIDLLFFRYIFNDLRDKIGGFAEEQYADEFIPIEAFQRTLERLFYVLKDPRGFNAKDYDENGNGFVGWGEFNYVYKKRKIIVTLSIAERIYLTFEHSDSSYLGMIISNVVLLAIMVSSLCFVLSTVPEYQDRPPEDPAGQPVPKEIFATVERVCLVFFVLEYLMRLLTCFTVRAEVFNRQLLRELTVSDEAINLPSAPMRLLRFILSPSNLVDLAAILPGVIALNKSVEVDGGGFIVLRLIRLTRIFKAFKTIRGPAVVIARTIQQSTKALYVLAFNLLLGIVIAGSLMWLVEGGEWDPATHTYKRSAGRVWNHVARDYEDIKEESPFRSIPTAFWWAIVTATTVGYGDVYPTTTLGYIVSVATMVFALVILSLPVGVVGGTFSNVWKAFDEEKKSEEEAKRREIAYITSAMQKIDPTTMSNLLFIEVWNERFPPPQSKGCLEQCGLRRQDLYPHPAEFMGQVRLELELPHAMHCAKTVEVPLREHYGTVKRNMTGQMKIRYEWTPKEKQPAPCPTSGLDKGGEDEDGKNFRGTLKVTLIGAERLINLNCSHVADRYSNPYCRIFCYPTSPADTAKLVQPIIWRTPTINNSLCPEWGCERSFDYEWKKISLNQEAIELKKEQCISRRRDPDGSTGLHLEGSPRFSEGKDKPPQPVQQEETQVLLGHLRELGSQVKLIKDEMCTLNSRVDQCSAQVDTCPAGADGEEWAGDDGEE